MTKDEALKLALEALEYSGNIWHMNCPKDKAITAIREALAQPEQEPVRLWLWKNFVNGRPEYWAFDNAFPINMNDGDPQTFGEPCGYAWFKPSRQGRFDVSDEEVLRAIQNAKEYPPHRKPLTDEEIEAIHQSTWMQSTATLNDFARAIEAAHDIVNPLSQDRNP